MFRDNTSGFTHLAGAVCAVIGAVLLGIKGRYDAVSLATVLIFGISMTLLFSASATYHLVTGPEKLIRACKIVDHCMIYVLIAGTYTPAVALALDGSLRMTYMIGIWACAAVGIIIKLFMTGKFRTTSTILYVLMGSTIVFALPTLHSRVGTWGMVLLCAGGVSYITGAVFYAVKKPNKFKEFGFHEIFHIFVLLGAFSHFALVYWYIL